MILNTIETKEDFFNFDHPKIYTILSFFLLILCLIILFLNDKYLRIEILDSLFYSLSFTSLIVFLISSFFLKFSKEDIKVQKTGIIKITTDHFIINNYKKIPFNKILDLKILIADFEGNFKYTSSDFDSNYSLGTDNYIIIKTKNHTIKKQIQLNSKRELNLVFNFISNQIVDDKFEKINAKKLVSIFNDDFKKTDKARNYIANQIKKNTFNTTEGLLMMNYSSDNEAKELKKKYNL